MHWFDASVRTHAQMFVLFFICLIGCVGCFALIEFGLLTSWLVACLPACVLVALLVLLFVGLFACLLACLLACLPAYLFLCLCVSFFVCLFACLCDCLFVGLFVRLFVCFCVLACLLARSLAHSLACFPACLPACSLACVRACVHVCLLVCLFVCWVWFIEKINKRSFFPSFLLAAILTQKASQHAQDKKLVEPKHARPKTKQEAKTREDSGPGPLDSSRDVGAVCPCAIFKL